LASLSERKIQIDGLGEQSIEDNYGPDKEEVRLKKLHNTES
jgi:hypothetical protein